jgi:hypothetical protein
MSAVDVHPSRSDIERPAFPQDAQMPQKTEAPPQWINDLMDAAQAGDAEFRKEVRSQIKAGRGAELIATVEGMVARTPESETEARKLMTTLLEAVKEWVENPDELEEGGRFFGRRSRYGGCGSMFGSAMGCGYYPMYGGGCYGGYGGYYGGCYPSIGYGGCYGGYGGYGGCYPYVGGCYF